MILFFPFPLDSHSTEPLPCHPPLVSRKRIRKSVFLILDSLASADLERGLPIKEGDRLSACTRANQLDDLEGVLVGAL
jgi:hypothetical protein